MLLSWVACIAVIALLAGYASPPRSLIPVSGGMPVMPPTPPPETFSEPAAEQQPTPGTPTMVPGLWYRAEMERRLGDCYASFHDFYLMEQVAVYEPAMLKNTEWLRDASSKAEDFRTTCELLGSLPRAPHSFREIDGWLKLAAAEAGPAADQFAAVVEEDDTDGLYRAIEHMTRFLEYTAAAESALERLDERKQF